LWEEAQRVQADIESGGGVVERATVKIPGEVQPIDLINDQIVLTARTNLTLGAQDRSLAESLVFHMQDSHTDRHAARISQCLGAL
jgi:hypothetical protein